MRRRSTGAANDAVRRSVKTRSCPRRLAALALALAAGFAGCGRSGPPPGAGGPDGAASAPLAAQSAGSAAPIAAPAASEAGSGVASPTAAISASPFEAATPDDATLGANVALAVLGGRVVQAGEADDPAWRAANLIDGFPVIIGMSLVSKGWQAASPAFPQEVVLGFHKDRQATIRTVVVDTASEGNLIDPAAVPKDVELFASTTSATAGFTSVARATLPAAAGETALRFAPVAAKWVRLVIASTHGGAPPQLGEIAVYEASATASIVADIPKNLLLPALGGNIVRFTSQAADMFAAELVDGITSDVGGWSSQPGRPEAPVQLPQEITFAFRGQQAAVIDRVVIDPTSGMLFYSGPKPNVTTWARTVELMGSDRPRDGFVSLAMVTIAPVARPVVVPIGKTLRFLKLRVLEVNGGDRVTLGEVQAFEAPAADGRSLVMGRRGIVAHAGAATGKTGTESATRREREPNDTPAQADPIGDATVGGIASETDRDVFAVAGAATATGGRQTLTVGLEGLPAIRTRATVRDAAGATVATIDPSQLTTGTRTRFSVLAPPGPLTVELAQPPGAQVVIWDTSGSMEKSVADLDAALRQYLAGTKANDRVQLIRFDDTIEVLMKEFSNQPQALLAALADKVYADGGTAIYDAVARGLEQLSSVAGNRAIVLMTDGADTSSTLDPAALWSALDSGRTRVFAVGLGTGVRTYVARAGTTAERVLADMAEQTGGRYTYLAGSAQLKPLYAAIAEELRAPATYAISARTSAATGMLSVASKGEPIAVPPRVELVLDASGSMKRAIGGRPMMEIAKAALVDVVARLPAGTSVALRVYGHRVREKQPGDCEDSNLEVPFGPLDRKRLTDSIRRVRALGTTPIAYSIRQAGEDLRESPGPAILIVVTDGREECKGDPAAEVEKLRASGLDVTLNIVGFGLTDPGDRAAMVAVAGAGKGSYYDAADEAALRAAIDRALAVPYTVVDVAGAVVARGVVGGAPIAVPEGEFSVRLESAGAPVVIEHVPIAAGKASAVELTKDADRVVARIVAPR